MMNQSIKATLLFVAITALTSANSQAASGEAHECISAAITDIQLTEVAEVNEIRVQLADDSPKKAILEVTVESRDSDRVLALDGENYKAIQFAPAMSGSEYRISLFPGAGGDHSTPACVESVELLSDGKSVALFRP